MSLTGPLIQENKKSIIKNIIIMLHGYGSNGDDLIQMANTWKEYFPNVCFSAPNAPFKFDKFPGGFMWFEAYPNGIHYNEASEQQKQKIMKDFSTSCDLIKKHINYLCKEYNLSLNKVFLLGFSQGSMMSIEVGTSLKESIGGIVSLSGRIYTKDFSRFNKNKIPILIVHGENDNIIPVNRYYETCETLEKNQYAIEKHLIKNMGHTINNDVMQISKNFIKRHLKD